MPDPRAVIALVLILFIIFSPDPQAPVSQVATSGFDTLLEREQTALTVLNTTQYGDFDAASDRWLNISGLTNDTNFAWDRLNDVRGRAKELSAYALGPDGQAGSNGDFSGTPLVLYQNTTGILHGTWIKSPSVKIIQAPQLNLTRYAPEGPFGPLHIPGFGRNLTGHEGAVRIRLGELDTEMSVVRRKANDEVKKDVVRTISAELELQATDGASKSWEARLYGVHFSETGNAVLTTTSEKFAGIFALPHMTASNYSYDQAQLLLNRTLWDTIGGLTQGSGGSSNPWTSHTDGVTENQFSMPNCELVVYLQQHPVDRIPAERGLDTLSFIEKELRFPSGAFLTPAKDMKFSMVAFSPDCGYVIESKGPPDFARQTANHLNGPKIEVEYGQGRHHLLTYAMILAAQLYLLTVQMRDASTPSTRSRISFYTIIMLALGDGFTTMAMTLISLFVPNLWILFMGTAFLSFLSVSFFGMRFLMDIWSVQAPERERRERERRAAASTSNNDTASQPTLPASWNAAALPLAAPSPPATDTLPLPVTARRPIDTGATPIFIPSDQDDTVDPDQTNQTTAGQNTENRGTGFGAMYTRFYLLLLATLFLSLNATSWPPGIRRVYFTIVALLYLSFWTPQIARNVNRNCRRALRWDFVLGQSVLRLVPFAYFYGYSHNVLFAEVDLIGLAVLASWLWLQCVVLISQELLGPRWFVASAWVPPAYDYHPVLREDEEGGNLPIGFSQASASAPPSPTSSAKPGESRDKGKKVFDCAICMQELDVAIVGPDSPAESSLASAGGLLARRAYMVTPCRHIFHSQCLEGWMKYRLQCPICREDLPPL